jgi:hypothetical protein
MADASANGRRRRSLICGSDRRRNAASASSRLSEDRILIRFRVEVLSALEDRYQLDLDERAFTEKATVGDIERMIEEKSTDDPPCFSYPRWPRRTALDKKCIPLPGWITRAVLQVVEGLDVYPPFNSRPSRQTT